MEYHELESLLIEKGVSSEFKNQRGWENDKICN